MKTTLVFGFIAGAIALDCKPGYKHKATVTTLKCSSSVISDNNCVNCCDPDPLKCGGKNSMTGNNRLACGNDHYPGDMGLSGAAQDTWENKATTAGNEKTNCCVAKATCGSAGATCPAGMKKVDANSATKCPSDAASCADAGTGMVSGWLDTKRCCENNALTCHGVGLVSGDCTGSKYYPSAAEMTDAWKGKAATATNKAAECCQTKAKCSDVTTCPAGMKKRDATATPATTECSGGVATCTATCCENDELKCGGLGVPTCASGKYYGSDDTWKNKATTDTNKATDCCMTKAKCNTYTCPAGMKAKSAAPTTDCAGGASSCNSGTCCDMITAATCDAFKAQVATSTDTSSGTYQLRPVLTMAMAVIAFLSMGHK